MTIQDIKQREDAKAYADKKAGACPDRLTCCCGVYYCGKNTNNWFLEYKTAFDFPFVTDLLFDDAEYTSNQ